MKNRFIYFAPIFSACAFCLDLNAASIVSQSGDWSSGSTWSDGVVPTTSSTAPLDSLSFASSGLTLGIDASTYYIGLIELGDIAVSNIDIAENQTLYIRNSVTNNPFFKSNSKDNVLNVNGAGKLAIQSPSGQIQLQGGILNLNVESTFQSIYALASSADTAGTINFNKNCHNTGQFSIGNNYTLNVVSGVTVSSSSAFNVWGANSSLNVAEGAKITATGGICLASGSIAGEVVSTGAMTYDSTQYGLSFGDSVSHVMTLESTVSITQNYVASQNQVRLKGQVTSYAGEGKIALNSVLYFCNSSSLTLNSSGAFLTRVGDALAATQGESAFYIVNYSSSKDNGKVYGASNTSISLGADNDFGSFVFYDGSVLNFETNGYKSVIGGIDLYADGANYEINMKNLSDFTVKLMSLDNVNYYADEDGYLVAENIYVLDSDEFRSFVYLIQDTENGGYWINTAVPEPSVYAGIFGVLALAFAVWRRRA